MDTKPLKTPERMYHSTGYRTAFQFILIFCFYVLAGRIALAHGGEDHGDTQKTVTISGSKQRLYAQSDNFELVIVADTLRLGERATLDLYLSDFVTNEPIGGATILVSTIGNEDRVDTALAETSPGLYELQTSFPTQGEADLLFDVTAGEVADIMELKGLRIESRSLGSVSTPTKSNDKVWYFIAGLAALLVLTFLFMRRRPGKTISTAILLVALCQFGFTNSFAQSVASEGQPGFMSKGSQFLIGLRTARVEKKSLPLQVHTIGEVMARPPDVVVVFPPQQGKLVNAAGVSYPQLGAHVEKDEPIAAIQTIDVFVIRSPIAGVITAVDAAPGEYVDPARSLFTITDLSRVWVSASVFESDLPALGKGPKAEISTSSYPRDPAKGSFVAFDPTADPETRTVKAIFELKNLDSRMRLGMIVDVFIEADQKAERLVVPSEAVMNWEGVKVVFVHIEPEIFEMREVRTLGSYGKFTSVEGDLRESERIVTTGAYQLLTIPHRLARKD